MNKEKYIHSDTIQTVRMTSINHWFLQDIFEIVLLS